MKIIIESNGISGLACKAEASSIRLGVGLLALSPSLARQAKNKLHLGPAKDCQHLDILLPALIT